MFMIRTRRPIEKLAVKRLVDALADQKNGLVINKRTLKVSVDLSLPEVRQRLAKEASKFYEAEKAY